MDGFIGREHELGRLEKIYGRPGPKVCAVYGRRQVGKSTLLRKFAEGKRAIIIQSLQSSSFENLEQMRSDVSAFLGKELDPFDTFTEVFRILSDICKEKTLIVFDEFPYLSASEPSVASIIQRFVDIELKNTDSMLVLCGSSISMMHRETEDPGRPLYGRVNDIMEVGPMTLRETMPFHDNMSDIDILRTYMTVGGLPLYHRSMKYGTYEECVKRCFIDRDALMKDEAENIIRSEFSPFRTYSGILACIAGGSVKQSEIASKLGIERPVCKRYLDNMSDLGIVCKRTPMLGAPKQPSYAIDDGLCAFYYGIIRRRLTILENNSMDTDKKFKMVSHDIDSFLGIRFEDACREYLSAEYDVKSIGSWWGRSEGEDTDIDIVATVIDDNLMEHTIFAECKFRKRPMTVADLEGLRKKAIALKGYSNGHLVLFSAFGFTDELKEKADGDGIPMVGLDEILGKVKAGDLTTMGLL